jgi:anti-anti-sigma factor
MKIQTEHHSRANSLVPKLLEEKKVPLSLEEKSWGDVTVVYCEGRIVFRNEALTLSESVTELLRRKREVILDLTKVDAVDSAGLGELVSLYMFAKGSHSSIKLCGLNSRVHHLLQITNLHSLFEIFPTDEIAMEMSCARTQ